MGVVLDADVVGVRPAGVFLVFLFEYIDKSGRRITTPTASNVSGNEQLTIGIISINLAIGVGIPEGDFFLLTNIEVGLLRADNKRIPRFSTLGSKFPNMPRVRGDLVFLADIEFSVVDRLTVKAAPDYAINSSL